MKLLPQDAADMEARGLIRHTGSDEDAAYFELTEAGRRYAPLLAALAAASPPPAAPAGEA